MNQNLRLVVTRNRPQVGCIIARHVFHRQLAPKYSTMIAIVHCIVTNAPVAASGSGSLKRFCLSSNTSRVLLLLATSRGSGWPALLTYVRRERVNIFFFCRQQLKLTTPFLFACLGVDDRVKNRAGKTNSSSKE